METEFALGRESEGESMKWGLFTEVGRGSRTVYRSGAWLQSSEAGKNGKFCILREIGGEIT